MHACVPLAFHCSSIIADVVPCFVLVDAPAEVVRRRSHGVKPAARALTCDAMAAEVLAAYKELGPLTILQAQKLFVKSCKVRGAAPGAAHARVHASTHTGARTSFAPARPRARRTPGESCRKACLSAQSSFSQSARGRRRSKP
ncbi:hypothetical protein EON67_11630, partial [archaeon]